MSEANHESTKPTRDLATLFPVPAIRPAGEPREVRAFEIFSVLPAGCRAVMLGDDRHWPHIRKGEWAVIDDNDTTFVSGELYAIEWSGGPVSLRYDIMQVNQRDLKGEAVIWFSPLNRPRSKEESDSRWAKAGFFASEGPRGIYLSDGPMYARYLPEKLRGRVIGLFCPGN